MNALARLFPILLGFALVTGLGAEEKKLVVGPFTFAPGTEWKAKEQARAMSQGGLTITAKDLKESLDADFYHFGEGQGGSVEANIERWRKQFSGEPKEVAREKIAGGKVEILHLEGTFLVGSPFGQKTPKGNQALLGAILPSEEGAVFVKLVGSKEDVAKVAERFKALVSSPFPKK